MAGPFYVDDGGDGTTETSWATADTSINALDAEYTFASGEIVYFGHNHVCQATNSASLTITGPTQDAPVLFISATQGSDPPAFQASTSNQIDTSEATTYDITFDGSFALYGLCIQAGRNILLSNDSNEMFAAYNTTFKPGDNARVQATQAQSVLSFSGCTISCAADTTGRSVAVFTNESSNRVEMIGTTFASVTNRTGSVFSCNINGAELIVSCADFTGFTNATPCEILDQNGVASVAVFSNCITAATWTPLTTNYPGMFGSAMFVNCGPADAPSYLVHRTYFGQIESSSSVYRTGGATIESTACSWLVTTRANVVSESRPFRTPWIYGEIASTGSKTFDVYITNDTADFTDAEVWLDVEFLGTADEANTTLATDWRHYPAGSSYITTTAAAQTDDTTSTWNGAGPSYTYKQKLSVTATVNEDGQYRARVCVGVANIAGSRYFFIDPKVTVS